MSDLPNTWFQVHSTTYGPLNLVGKYVWIKYFQSSMWEPRGLSSGSNRCKLTCLHMFKMLTYKGGLILWGTSSYIRNAHFGGLCQEFHQVKDEATPKFTPLATSYSLTIINSSYVNLILCQLGMKIETRHIIRKSHAKLSYTWPKATSVLQHANLYTIMIMEILK